MGTSVVGDLQQLKFRLDCDLYSKFCFKFAILISSETFKKKKILITISY